MLEVLGAVLAGMLTTLAPCAFTLLPVVVGGSISGVTDNKSRNRALVIVASLLVSVFLFTLALKASTALIGIPASAWQWLSGGLLIALGLTAIFPNGWDKLSFNLGFSARSNKNLTKATRRDGWLGAVLTGAALGPVFTSCSPLYGYVIVTVLPADLAKGLVLLLAYLLGLGVVLIGVALLGQRLTKKLRWAADPHSWLRRGMGVLFVVLGFLIITGLMQDLEAWIITNSPIKPWELERHF